MLASNIEHYVSFKIHFRVNGRYTYPLTVLDLHEKSNLFMSSFCSVTMSLRDSICMSLLFITYSRNFHCRSILFYLGALYVEILDPLAAVTVE